LVLSDTVVFRTLEGFKLPGLQFRLFGKPIHFAPPDGWKYSGDAKTLDLSQPAPGTAKARLTLLGRKPVDATLAIPVTELRGIALSTVKGFAGGEIEPEEITMVPEPYSIGLHSTVEFQYSFARSGSRFMASVALTALTQTDILAVIIVAKTVEFPAVRDEMIGAMNRWIELE
jgi:hypothetical protein